MSDYFDDFEEYFIGSASKNVMFCLYRTDMEEDKNNKKKERCQINMLLDAIQNELISEKETEVCKAFVYGMDKIYVKSFKDCKKNTMYYYSNKMCNKKISISQILIIALEVLKKQYEENGYEENLLYVLVDGEYSMAESKKMCAILMDYASDFAFEPILVLNKENVEQGHLEAYIVKNGKLRRFLDFRKNKVTGEE